LTKITTFSYGFRQHDENHYIFVDEVLVLVLVGEKHCSWDRYTHWSHTIT